MRIHPIRSIRVVAFPVRDPDMNQEAFFSSSSSIHRSISTAHFSPPSIQIAMDSLAVLLTYHYPQFPYLEQELARRGCHLLRLYDSPKHDQLTFLRANASSIRAVIGDTHVGVDEAMIDALPFLEIVASFSVGLDKVDLVKCKERGIRVTNTPDVLTDDVADLAIGLAIAVMRKIPAADRFVRSSGWKKGDYTLTTKFSGKKVGILGLGRIGLAIAKRAEAFNCPISYYSRSEKPYPNYKYYPTPLDLASNCEVLFISCALTSETFHIVNSAVIEALGPQGFLINIGRGAHVDEAELIPALVEGRLGGAGLDVFENEPEVPEVLFQLDNVVMTPHVGSDTKETIKAMADLVIANIEAHVMGWPLLTPVV